MLPVCVCVCVGVCVCVCVSQVVLDGCETWALTLREEQRLRVFENKVLRKIRGVRETKLQENGENYIMHCILRMT